MCVLTPKGAFQPFSSLPSGSLLLPAEATRWPSNHAVHRKGEEQKGLFHPLHSPCSCAFGFRHEKCLQQPPPSCFVCSHPSLLCGLGARRAGPGAVSERLPPAGPQGRAGITGKGKSAGAPACARAAASNRLRKVPEPCGTQPATWEEGQACLEACHTA